MSRCLDCNRSKFCGLFFFLVFSFLVFTREITFQSKGLKRCLNKGLPSFSLLSQFFLFKDKYRLTSLVINIVFLGNIKSMTNLITLSIFHINKFCTEIILINQRTREHITYWDLIICMTTYRKNAWLLNTHESTSCVCKANPLTNIGLQFPIFNKCQHSSTHS